MGIGVQIEYDELFNIRVVTPLEGTPAQRAGVHPKDIIEKVDGRNVLGLSLDQADRLFTRTLVAGLNGSADRPWAQLRKGRAITDQWLSQQLRPYGIHPRTFRIEGEQAKGYLLEDCLDVFRRYIPRSEVDALSAESRAAEAPEPQGPVAEPSRPAA